MVFFGEPILLNEDEKMNGSLIFLKVKDQAEAEKFAENDPYNKAGLFKDVIITRYLKK